MFHYIWTESLVMIFLAVCVASSTMIAADGNPDDVAKAGRPTEWSAADVQRWFTESRKIGRAAAEEFEGMDGTELLSMELTDFIEGEEAEEGECIACLGGRGGWGLLNNCSFTMWRSPPSVATGMSL